MLDGDEWVINGQKVWTTQAQFADYCFLLARTDPDVAKHAGISYLLVPMQQPGVEVRPITQPDGTAEFNEVFFADARCPEANVVGGLNNGWAVANTTLGFERGPVGHHRVPPVRGGAPAHGRGGTAPTAAIDDPMIRQRLAEYYTKIQIIRINGLRTLTATRDRPQGPGGQRRSAPRTRCAGPRCTRRPWSWPSTSSARRRCSPTAARPRARGRRALRSGQGEAGYTVSPMVSTFFFSRSETIWGGTSQIQRNIVGERVLGLPKEPKASAK